MIPYKQRVQALKTKDPPPNGTAGAGSSCLGQSEDCQWVEFPKVGTEGQQQQKRESRVNKGKREGYPPWNQHKAPEKMASQ